MSQLNKTSFNNLYGSSGTIFPDNTTQEISEGDVRNFGQDISDSFLSISDNFIDEDDMTSNSATKAPSQQSVKAYVDNNVTLRSSTISLNAAQFMTEPFEILPAPGANKYYHVLGITVYYKFGTTPFDQKGRGFVFTYGLQALNTTEISNLESSNTDRIIRVYLREHAQDIYTTASNLLNKPILLIHGDTPTDGDGTFKITIEYVIVTVS